MSQYWVSHDGQRTGPFDRTQTAASYAKGALPASDLVWTEGMANWAPASEVFGPNASRPPIMPPPLSPTGASRRPPDSPYAPPTARVVRDDQEAGGAALPYAGFWVRLCASFLDGLILVFLSFGVGVVAGVVSAAAHMPKEDIGNIATLLALVGCWLYFALLESGERRATLGKRAFKLEVATQEGQERIGFGRATGRYFGRLLSMIILYIGYLMQPFTPRKQALHDMLCGTVVVTRGPASGVLIAVVVVLVLFVPLTGILAAIALPAYSDYTMRAQVADGVQLSSAVKSAVAEYYAIQGKFPTDTATLGFTGSMNSRNVSAITVREGGIDIEYGNQANRQIAGRHLGLQVIVDTDGNLAFVCGEAPPPAGFNVAASSGRPATDLPARFLPAACRPSARG